MFIVSGSGGLDNPSAIVFENGKFYVVSTRPTTSNSVLEYSVDGEFIRAVVPTGSGGLAGPADLVFRDGYLYVSSWTNNKVLRYSGSTGDFVDEVASGGGLVTPLGLLFDSDGKLLVSSRDADEIRRYAVKSQAAFNVSLSAPSSLPVTVQYDTVNVSAMAGSDFIGASDTITFAPGQTSQTILVQTIDNTAAEPNETFNVVLSAATGGVIVDGTGVGTIIDDDTKFYVVDDGSTNGTFEYNASGNSLENYTVATGNTAPRGAASTAAGDKIWVVDANRNVGVYGPSGNLLGSWTAGTLNAAAVVEGITTNGTDVWIVDAKSDKVFRYAGAASRLSGSQNAASNFALNKSNTNPKDLVTDGQSIWVVENGASTDKVFQYTVSGTLQRSWTISGGGGSPTGITLDPSNATLDLWIVDNTTDKVYRLPSGRTNTAPSLTAIDPFSLSPTNTNRQGPADPPTLTRSVSEGPATAQSAIRNLQFCTTPPSSPLPKNSNPSSHPQNAAAN